MIKNITSNGIIKTGTGYKIIKTEGNILNICNSMKVKEGEWVTDSNVNPIPNMYNGKNIKYKAGFHFFKHLKDAIKLYKTIINDMNQDLWYKQYYLSKEEEYKLYKIKYQQLVAEGIDSMTYKKEDETEVGVAKKIYIEGSIQ